MTFGYIFLFKQKHNFLNIDRMTTEVIKKENLIDMPDNSDMVAEAMKEVKCFLCRQNTQWIILKSNISCQSTSKRSLMKSMELTGIVLLAKISPLM